MAIKRIIKYKISDCIYYYKKYGHINSFNGGGARILLYHAIQECNFRTDKMGLAVPQDVFYMQMKYLKEEGFYVTGLSQLIDTIIYGRLIPEKSIAITFDDGYKSIFKNAFPILKEFNFSAALFINIFVIERRIPECFYWHAWDALSWEEIKALSSAGIAIGSHGYSHRGLDKLSEKELQYEISKSQDLIESRLGSKANTFSYPNGTFNRSVKNALKKNNFICSCSSIEGVNDAGSDIFALKRTEITAFDNTLYKFKKKISGCYDWLRFIRADD